MLSSLQKITVPSLLAQHQAQDLDLCCILRPFASHHRLLQDISRGKCLDTGTGSEVWPSQDGAANGRVKLCFTPWVSQSFPVCGVYWGDWSWDQR